jgi:Zn-dependent protease
LFVKRIQLFRAFGIPIYLDLSWFVVALLISWSLADNVFPSSQPGQSTLTYWALGITATLGLFVSIVFHELAHALVARRFSVPIRGITLFIFGGVAEMEEEPPNARAEFLVAVAGPIASVGVALICFGSAVFFSGLQSVATVLNFLAGLNLILVIFNMIPAFPLDGGRVLRSILWHWRTNLPWATRVTSAIGSAFGVVLIALGLYRALFGGDLIGGLWSFLIGIFLRNAAQMSYRHVVMRRALEGEQVARFMVTDPVVVPRSIPIADLVRSYVYKHHFKMFPVVESGKLLGCVNTRAIKQLPQEEWERQSVSSILEPCSSDNTIAPGADAMQALSRMSRSRVSRLMVVEGDRLIGILALKDLLKFLSLKVELEGENGQA